MLGEIRAALGAGRVDSLHASIERLVRLEDDRLQSNSASQLTLRRASALIFLGALIGLVVLVTHLRRRLSDQLARALESHKVIGAQNERLRAKGAALAEQTEQLQNAATEMEIQAAELEEQTMELESTIEELRESERRLRATADDSAQLSRRLAEAQRVAQLGYWEIDSGTAEVFWSEEMYTPNGSVCCSRL